MVMQQRRHERKAMRSIIVEGMDGSGKDTLIDALIKAFPDHTLHERASTSLGGPVHNLSGWVARDSMHLTKTSRFYIYNRHPLISEPIYGKYRPGKPTDPIFTNAGWLAAYRKIVSDYTVLVICQPPYPMVRNVLWAQGPDAHMPGVYDNALDLYTDYKSFVWPGKTIRYNYVNDRFETLTRLIDRSLEEHNNG